MIRQLALAAALVAAGCGDNSGGNTDASANGDGGTVQDLAPPADMVDTTAIPAPTSKHVGATGVTAGLVSAGITAAAYVLTPTGNPPTGELHVVTADGTDKKIDTGVGVGDYMLTNDGKQVIYVKPAGPSLVWADASAATPTPKTLFSAGLPSPTLAAFGFMSPSGHFFLCGILPSGVAASPDLHVIDMRTGMDVYQRLNGEFDYLELMLPDDTLLFEDTAGGTSTNTPPVETLYWIALPPGSAQAASITTRAGAMVPTADNQTLVIQKTSGDLYTWDVKTHTLSSTAVATAAAKFTVGGAPNGPIAYVGGDGSVHVVTTDGMKLLDTPASAMTSINAPIVLAPDAGDVYFFQNGDLTTGGVQNNQGTLMRVAVQSGATPSKVADQVSIRDVQPTDNALLFLQNVGVPPKPPGVQLGDAVAANRDGSNITPLGMKVPVGGLRVVNPGPDTWFALHLATTVDDSATNTPIDGSLAAYGALGWDDYTGAAELTLDTKVHEGAFGFAADGRTAAFSTGATWDATVMNYVGGLSFIAARAPSMKVDGMLAGVSELGPILSRSLFVNAPKATTAGVYFVTY